MQFLTDEGCRAWMQGHALGTGEWPTTEGSELPLVKGTLGFALSDVFPLASMFSVHSEVLLWVTATRIWSANLHLYYRFRESYGDRRLVEDAPGHLFLDYEQADLLSYVQICVQSGWDFWVLGGEDYARLFVSHDEYFLARTSDPEALARFTSLT